MGGPKDGIWVPWDFGSTGAVQGNNFGDGTGPTEDWLIMTDPINFLFFRNETFDYKSQQSFKGPDMFVLWSTDYDPAIHADPNDAAWTPFYTDTSSASNLTEGLQGPLDISAIPDTAYIAFNYTGLGSASGQS